MRKYLLSLACVLVSGYPLAEPVLGFTVSTDFPGGSAEVKRIDVPASRLEICPAHHDGRGWPCWWYLRVDGAEAGKLLTLQVTASDQPFRDGHRLAAAWALPLRPAISTDNSHWEQTEPGTISRESGTYQIVAPADRFWLAWGPPFLPSHAEALLEAALEKLPDAERFVLAVTRDGRKVPGLRCGNHASQQVIWVQARQHAWEAGGSWVGSGFLKWFTSDEAEAVDLRDSCELIFIPIMDVDNVAIGAGGKEAIPRDHNRDWALEPVYPEVAAAQQWLGELIEGDRLRVFLDLHNPGANARQPYFYGPLDFESMTGPRRQNYERFLTTATEAMRAPLAIQTEYQFATYVQTAEERQRVSGNWVRDHGSEAVVALTLETAWNTPHSTTEGYEHVGRGLARTVAHFLQR